MTAAVVALRRGQPLVPDGRQVFRLYPRFRVGSGRWIYAIGYADGRTKLGIARDPRQRMFQHWIASDGSMQWSHLFGHYDNRSAAAIERLALRMAAEISQRIRLTETFLDLSREDAIRCVRVAVAERGGLT